jgi:hypothetical protein
MYLTAPIMKQITAMEIIVSTVVIVMMDYLTVSSY